MPFKFETERQFNQPDGVVIGSFRSHMDNQALYSRDVGFMPSSIPIAEFSRDYAIAEMQPVLLRMDTLVQDSQFKVRHYPPRDRHIVIAVGDKLAISFPDGQEPQRGHHACAGPLIRYLGGAKNVDYIFNGYVKTIASEKPGIKGKRVVKICKMHPRDRAITPIIASYELGKVQPEACLTPEITQGILHGLEAQSLQVVYADPSIETYSNSKKQALYAHNASFWKRQE